MLLYLENARRPAITDPPMRYFWYSEKLLKTGVEKHKIDGCIIKIFNSDASWRRFIEILKYKALFLGKKVLSVNPKMTSQKCSNCKNIVEKSLSVRTHECPECGFIANRDIMQR